MVKDQSPSRCLFIAMDTASVRFETLSFLYSSRRWNLIAALEKFPSTAFNETVENPDPDEDEQKNKNKYSDDDHQPSRRPPGRTRNHRNVVGSAQYYRISVDARLRPSASPQFRVKNSNPGNLDLAVDGQVVRISSMEPKLTEITCLPSEISSVLLVSLGSGDFRTFPLTLINLSW